MVSRRKKFLVTAAAAITLMVASSAGAFAGTATTPALVPAAPNATPIDLLDTPRRGKDAWVKVGNKMAEAARRNNKTEKELSDLLSTDPTAALDRGGLLHYVEPKQPEAVIATVDPVTSSAAPFAYDQTFKLHSKTGSSKVVYLDLDGHVVSGTAWNTNYTSGAAFTAEPFDMDGSPSTFSNAEMDTIQLIWQRVAEDYAAFDIDVTTEEPAADAITRSSSTDNNYGTRAVITYTNTIYSACGCGGIAYVGTYDLTSSHSVYQPAFVFQRGVGSGSKNIAEATSHEVGHNLGLSHDGTATVGYYTGQGAWAPIMGVGYNRPVSQWSKGEYAGANQTQDDLVVMAANGAVTRVDDHGDTAATATGLGVGPALTGDGRITTRADIDAFSFTAGAGAATITASPIPTGPNLDIKLTLLRADGSVVATADPAVSSSGSDVVSGLAASISTTLTAGTYTVLIDGVGFGDPLTTGYTDYGSLGTYTVSGTVTTDGGPVNQAPVARATASTTTGVAPLNVTLNGSTSTDADGTIVSYAWNLGNGTTSPAANPSATYSTAGTYTATLTVTDNLGATSSASVVITVTAPPQAVIMKVAAITGGTYTQSGRRGATAKVQIVNSSGQPVAGAVVTGSFSGTVNSSTSGTTASDGTVTLRSTRTSTRPASVTFNVTNVTKTGVTYTPAANTVTTITVSWT